MPARNAIGSHVSAAGGLLRVFARAEAVGAEVVQLFVSSPRAWAVPAPDPRADAEFAAARADRALPVYVHAPYLINLGATSGDVVTRSRQALEFALRRGAAIGAAGVVVHAGSAVGSTVPADAMAAARRTVHDALSAVDGIDVLIEPTAGGGGALAATAASLRDFLDALGRDARIGVCLDTCHMHAAGHDLSTVRRFGAELRAYAAAAEGQVRLVHVNDSRDPAGSLRDRHTALGSGTIGIAPFGALFTTGALAGVPLVVETAESDHASDIASLVALRDRRRNRAA